MIKQSKFVVIAVAAAVTVGLLTTGACESGPECGNGKVETGETCDKGSMNGMTGVTCSSSCQLRNIDSASVQVFYSRLMNQVPGYIGASCGELGIKEAKIRLVGPTTMEDTWQCSQNSKTFGGVMAGEYQAFATLYDASGAALTKEISSEKMSVAIPGSINLALNFTFDDFLKTDYVGTYYFVPNWGANDAFCAAANVDQMQVTMKPKGSATPVTAVVTPTVPLDGTSTACFTPGTAPSIKVANITWGYYDLTIAGLDATSAISFCKKFEAFVGPGAGTPTFDLLVDAATTCM